MEKFEKFEIKINKIKRKMNRQILGIVMFMVFSAVCIFAMEMLNNFKRQKQIAQDSYNKSLYEMVGYINNIENDLAKVQVTNTAKLTTITFADIWRQANLAKTNLESLPVNQKAMSNTSKYLSQISDFSYVLMKQTISNQKLNNEQYDKIIKMYEKSVEISDVMEDVYDDLNFGRIKWDELKKEGNKQLPNIDVGQIMTSVEKIGKTFQDYEGLIYDGAFSDHLLSQIPKSLSNKDITKEIAQKKISEIFGDDKIEKITFKEESNGRIDLYNFDVKLKNIESNRNVSITKKDGKMYLMLSDRKVNNDNISMDIAKQKGLEFLKQIGINNLVDTYFLKIENMAIINYAAIENNIVLYPDLVKVKVALDTGEVCGVEAQGYIFNHVKRENIMPKISFEYAKSMLNPNIVVEKEGLCIIPTESKGETLVYEFKGNIDKKEYLIYINAINAQEEKVLLIIDTPGGILTM
ncbi:MAG: germination protein YpeB [Clostridia bacterium]